MKNLQKGSATVVVLIIIIVLLVIGGGIYIYSQNTKNSQINTPSQNQSGMKQPLTENDILTATYHISANLSAKMSEVKTPLAAVTFPTHTTSDTMLTNPVYIDGSGNMTTSSFPAGGEAFWIHRYTFTDSTHTQAMVYIEGNYGASAFDGRAFIVTKVNGKVTTQETTCSKALNGSCIL